jgi:hypothetical protein
LAVIVWLPTANDEVVNVAWSDPFNVTLDASVVLPSRKFTVPVGVPVPEAAAATVAVKVTVSPVTEGLVVETSVVVVAALLTT